MSWLKLIMIIKARKRGTIMNELMIFEGHGVEVFELNGQVLFNPYHVGECLEISSDGVRKAITRMNQKQAIKVKNSDVTNCHIRKLNNAGENFLTESGVYKLVFKSHKPNAEKFTDWVTDEVLPSIRKHGIYATDKVIDNVLNNPDFGIRLLTELKKEKQEKEEERQARIQAEQKSQQLYTDNKALSGKLLDWADRDRINAGIRKLAASTGIKFGDMYKELYKNIEYSHKIYLKSRMERDKNKKKNASCLDYVKDDEWAKILKTFCAMCEAYGKSPKDMMQQTTPKNKLSVADNKYAWLDNM